MTIGQIINKVKEKWRVVSHSPFFIGTRRTTLRYVSFQLYRGLSSKIASLERIGMGADESRSRSPSAPICPEYSISKEPVKRNIKLLSFYNRHIYNAIWMLLYK